MATTAVLVAIIASLAMIVVGVLIGTGTLPAGAEAAWIPILWLVGPPLLVIAATVLMTCVLNLLGKTESAAHRTHDVLLDVRAGVEEQTRLLRAVAENTQLSDAARSIAHREREQDVLRQAINEDILREDWEAAYYLVEQLERRFGYKLESEQLRKDIDTSRSTLVSRKVDEAAEQVKNLMATHDWERARRGMDQLTKRFAEHPLVKTLPQEFEQRRSEHKRRLLKEWDQAVQRDEVDRGIRVLRELDQYLSPDEAEALKEAARDVFRARLHQLGVQFKLAVTDGEWAKAMGIGRQIMSEFPNTRMAKEVKERYSVLEQRAERTHAGVGNT